MFKFLLWVLLLIPFLSPSLTRAAADCNSFKPTIRVNPANPTVGQRVDISAQFSGAVSGYTVDQIKITQGPGLSACISIENGTFLSCLVESTGSKTATVAWDVVETNNPSASQECSSSIGYELGKTGATAGSTQNKNPSGGSATKSSADEPPGLPQIEELFGRLIRVVGVGVFFALTIMLVVGGIKFLTSGGEAKPIQSAQQTITWAVLGVLFLVLSWLFLLLISSFTGIDLTKFSLKFG